MNNLPLMILSQSYLILMDKLYLINLLLLKNILKI